MHQKLYRMHNTPYHNSCMIVPTSLTLLRTYVIALIRSMMYYDIPQVVVESVLQYYKEEEAINLENSKAHMPMSEEQCVRAERVLASVNLCYQELITGLFSHHWLMHTKPSVSLISVMSRYPPAAHCLTRMVGTG